MFVRHLRRECTWHRRGDAPVDTHVLIHHSNGHRDWLDQCLASMENEPTNILLVRDQGTNVGAARAAAMLHGDAPLQCFVDDDDFVSEGAFAACIAALEDPALAGAYTRFRTIDARSGAWIKENGAHVWSRAAMQRYVFEVMHLHVYRRSAAAPHLKEIAQWPTAEEALLMGLIAAHGDWLKIDRIGYTKRAHRYGAGARITGPMLQTLRYRLRPILSPAQDQPQGIVKRALSRPTGCRSCDGVRARIVRR